MSNPVFEHRHFTWLAHWARVNLDTKATKRLADDLAGTNPRFDRGHFMAAATTKPINWRDEARNNEIPYSAA